MKENKFYDWGTKDLLLAFLLKEMSEESKFKDWAIHYTSTSYKSVCLFGFQLSEVM